MHDIKKLSVYHPYLEITKKLSVYPPYTGTIHTFLIYLLGCNGNFSI